jgi:RimJ/RimL family protein N-acetyltransferase
VTWTASELAATEQALATERLVLEPLTRAHAPRVFPALADPALFTFVPEDAPATLAALEARYEKLARRRSPDGRDLWLNWVACAGGEPVGTVEATVQADRSAYLAYFVFRRFWRKGLAREACARVIVALGHEWKVTRIVAEMDTRNVASWRLAESLGFTRTAEKPEADFFKGSRSDEYRYELEPGNQPDPPHAAQRP